MCMIDINQDEMYRRGVCEHQDKYSRRNHGEHRIKITSIQNNDER